MTWLVESATTILVLGAIVEAILLLALIRTGRAALIAAMAATAVLFGVLLIVERQVITDREKVDATMEGTAEALEANDVQATLAFISPDAVEMREKVSREMSRVRIQDVKLADVQVTFNKLTSPPSAKVDFLAIIKGSYLGMSNPYENAGIRMQLELQEEDDRWLMINYSLSPSRVR